MSQPITIILHPDAIALINRILKKAKTKKV